MQSVYGVGTSHAARFWPWYVTKYLLHKHVIHRHSVYEGTKCKAFVLQV